MTRITSLLVATLLGVCFGAASAQAQLSRTFVSALTGNDASNCDRPTPCRTFQVAHDKTNDQGEITVLDPGGYGTLTITKSISIMNDGVGEAGVLVSRGDTGITVDAGAGGYVNLRGITIQGIGLGGGTGLLLKTAFSLTIENCVIRNHTGQRARPFSEGQQQYRDDEYVGRRQRQQRNHSRPHGLEPHREGELPPGGDGQQQP
jgi:hypothetical protein